MEKVNNNILFYSDPHLGHGNIIGFCDRPFKNANHMNTVLIDKYNSLVQPDDTVYWLGDVAIGMDPSRLKYIIKDRLNGNKILIPGNHDKPMIYKFFDEFHSSLIIEFEGLGKTLMLHHPVYPPKSKEQLEEEAQYAKKGRPVSYGPVEMNRDKYKYEDFNTILSGHVHQHWVNVGHTINVGVDAWNMGPVSLEELVHLRSEIGDV